MCDEPAGSNHKVLQFGKDITSPVFEFVVLFDNGYPHDGCAVKNPYPHDRRADKDSYPHDSNNQCVILRLQLSFTMINVQLILV